jgi:hypothetical protein
MDGGVVESFAYIDAGLVVLNLNLFTSKFRYLKNSANDAPIQIAVIMKLLMQFCGYLTISL